MAKRYFIFLYPEPGRLKSFLDLAIFLLNPREKWPAHVTVAGPFPNKNRFRLTNRRFEKTVFGLGVGNFFQYQSGTVYIRVGFEEREGVWRKPDFQGQPIPHMTLFDGPDMEFARKVFAITARVNPYFSFPVRGLHVVETVSGQYRADLREVVDLSLLDELHGISHDDVARLPENRRLTLFEKTLTQAIA